MSIARKCKIEECSSIGTLHKNGRYYLTKGMCSKHYSRWKRYKDTSYVHKPLMIRQHYLYGTWDSMVQRCTNPNSRAFNNYGGRGIKVCERWRNSFIDFISDMGERPEGHTLERKNNSHGYYPENCTWATRRRQSINTRIRSDNTTGVKGVHMDKSRGLWVAYITDKGKHIHLGRFIEKEEAIKARILAEKQYWKNL